MKKFSIKGFMALMLALVLSLAMSMMVLAYEDGDQLIVTGDNVRVRSAADTTADNVVKTASAGETVIYKSSTTGNDGKEWYQVQFSDGTTGYIRYDFVKAGAPAEEPTEEAITEETVEGEEEYVEGTPDEGTEEAAPAETGSSSYSINIVPQATTEVPEGLPAAYEATTITGTDIPAWKNSLNEHYFVIYAQNPTTGETGFYLCQTDETGKTNYVLYDASMLGGSGNGKAAAKGGASKTVVFVLVGVCVILIIISTILGIKVLNNGNDDDDDYDYDDDDDDDDEEEEEAPKKRRTFFKKVSRDEDEDEDEDDDEEDEDDEEDYVPVRRPARPQTARPAQSRPQGTRPVQSRPANSNVLRNPEARPQGARPVQSRPQGARPAVQGRSQGARPAQGRPQGARPVQGRPQGARPAQSRPQTRPQARPVDDYEDFDE